jgi:16S rRNA (adenine1518-N6/adenine1519-N6)-dimethyltransferase
MEIVNTGEMLKKYDIRPIKSLGQNLLTDINIIRKIVETADVQKEDLVLEIGPGLGSMTLQLAKSAGRVVAVEIDRHMIPALEEVLAEYDNTSVIHEDIMKADLFSVIGDWKGPLKVVSNLPYYITTPIIMKLLESGIPWESLVFMVQKEVGQRLAASPGCKDYSVLSVAIQLYSDPEYCFVVSKNCFLPKPDVDSAVVRLKKADRSKFSEINVEHFFRTVKAGFSQRRKTIMNSLGAAPWISGGKERLREVLGEMGVSEMIRAECLSLEQFVELSGKLPMKGSEEVLKEES